MAGVAGRSGRTPKRSTEKMGHRTKAELASIDRIQVAGTVEQPPAYTHWHPIARDWYRALAKSGQAIFYEPSDWAAAQYAAEAISKNLNAAKFSSQLFAAAWSALNDLMTTEGSRRRMRVELERANSDVDAAARNQAIVLDYQRHVHG
jgi:hypothetical protein